MDAKQRMFGEATVINTGAGNTISLSAEGVPLLNSNPIVAGLGSVKYKFFSIVVLEGPASLSVTPKWPITAPGSYAYSGVGAGFEDHGLISCLVNSGQVKFYFWG